MTPSAYLTVAAVVLALVLFGTVTGRYILRRMALALGVVAAGAVLVLDGNSPL
jgi:xanthine/uracil permease